MKASNQDLKPQHDIEFKHIVEIERLGYLNSLFQAIALDGKHNEGKNTNSLSKLGSYLACDFIHYTQDELDDLEAQALQLATKGDIGGHNDE